MGNVGRTLSPAKCNTEAMDPTDKRVNKDIKDGNIRKPIEDLPAEWEKEDDQIDGAKPNLGELEEDPAEL